jgi:putative solute:sodium symporter small subunit
VSSGRRRIRVRAAREERRVVLRSPRDELAEATAHGEVYLRRLRHAQLQLSLLALTAFGAVFGVLPIALYLLPQLHRVRLLDVPVALWVMVVPLLPLFLAIGWLYARRADALDDAFRDLVER